MQPLPAVSTGSQSLALPAPRSLPSGASLPSSGARGTHWHSGQARRPSAVRPRRQPAQKSWKQSSRQGCSYCARHSGHTSGGPLAASRAPGPSRGAKIAPDIFGHSAGGRRGARGPSAPAPPPSYLARWTPRGVQRWWSGEQRAARARGWGLECRARGERAGGARRGQTLCRRPPRLSTAALEGQSVPPTQRPASPGLPLSHLPSTPPPPQEFPSRCPLGDPSRHPFCAGRSQARARCPRPPSRGWRRLPRAGNLDGSRRSPPL